MYTPRGTLDRDSVIERYGKMVRYIAVKLAARLPASIELDDLIQAGMIGLVDAVSRFDSSVGVQFDTFAMQRVKGAMLDELRQADWMPRSVRKSQRTIEKAIHSVEQRQGRAALEAEIAAEMNISTDEYYRLLSAAKGSQIIYLEDVFGDDDDGRIEQDIPDEAHTPEQRLASIRFREDLVNAIDVLPERERLVMSLYYTEELTLKEIGEVLGVTESRVSQLHSQAIARLRAKLRDWTQA
ncbi:MAG: RNA polymerase sigma factor FliA [Lautropia sp.]|nr:RNA polymerase sigma factor FliA [Lautropia sp.]